MMRALRVPATRQAIARLPTSSVPPGPSIGRNTDSMLLVAPVIASPPAHPRC